MVFFVFTVAVLRVFVYLFFPRRNEWNFLRGMKWAAKRNKILWLHFTVAFWFSFFIFLSFTFSMNRLNIWYLFLFFIKLMKRHSITIFSIVLRRRLFSSDLRVTPFFFVLIFYEIVVLRWLYSIFRYDRKLIRHVRRTIVLSTQCLYFFIDRFDMIINLSLIFKTLNQSWWNELIYWAFRIVLFGLLNTIRTVNCHWSRRRIAKLACMIAMSVTMMVAMMMRRSRWRRYMSSVGISFSTHFSFEFFDSSLYFWPQVEVFFLNFFAFLHMDNNYNNIITSNWLL